MNGLSITDPVDQNRILAFPFGPDGLPNTADDPTDPPLANRQVVAAVIRAVIFRLLPQDHPDFTGGNSAFDVASLVSPGIYGTGSTTETTLLQAYLTNLRIPTIASILPWRGTWTTTATAGLTAFGSI